MRFTVFKYNKFTLSSYALVGFIFIMHQCMVMEYLNSNKDVHGMNQNKEVQPGIT
jgi:hypothetical protein